jgi:hypothetical protein
LIELRQTNRRHFETDPVPADVVELLVASSAAERATLFAIENADDRATLARLSQRADAEQITNPAYRAELRSWTTTDEDRDDGVPARVVPHVDGSAGDDVPIRDFDSQGVGWLPAMTRSSAGQCLFVLGTDTDSPRDWVRAGEALERVWLEITRSGFVASLFTQAIEIGSIRAKLRSELRLAMQPHLVLRVGRARVTAASPRRRVSDVLDGQPEA